jgi:hypothetical protein
MRYYRDNLTQERLKEILNYDPLTGKFTRIKTNSYKLKPGCEAGSKPKKSGHIFIQVDKDLHLAHRLAWLYYYGEYPKRDIDHINGNASDNRIKNLRNCETHQNLFNRDKQKNNKSGYKNVSWCTAMNKWVVRLMIDKKYKTIGYYDNVDKANEIAISTRKMYQKQFAIDNRINL